MQKPVLAKAKAFFAKTQLEISANIAYILSNAARYQLIRRKLSMFFKQRKS